MRSPTVAYIGLMKGGGALLLECAVGREVSSIISCEFTDVFFDTTFSASLSSICFSFKLWGSITLGDFSELLWQLVFGTKGEELADNIGPDRVEAGAGDLFGDGLDTERLLAADTPSPNSKSREKL